jgi:hypothetical protein
MELETTNGQQRRQSQSEFLTPTSSSRQQPQRRRGQQNTIHNTQNNGAITPTPSESGGSESGTSFTSESGSSFTTTGISASLHQTPNSSLNKPISKLSIMSPIVKKDKVPPVAERILRERKVAEEEDEG